MARKLIQMDAVILDELGYVPFPKSGGELLIIVTSSKQGTILIGLSIENQG